MQDNKVQGFALLSLYQTSKSDPSDIQKEITDLKKDSKGLAEIFPDKAGTEIVLICGTGTLERLRMLDSKQGTLTYTTSTNKKKAISLGPIVAEQRCHIRVGQAVVGEGDGKRNFKALKVAKYNRDDHDSSEPTNGSGTVKAASATGDKLRTLSIHLLAPAGLVRHKHDHRSHTSWQRLRRGSEDEPERHDQQHER